MNAKGVFINLATNDVQKSRAFFVGLGLELVKEFSDDSNSCLKAGENLYIMLMTPDKFKGFTKKELTNSKHANEALFTFEVETKEDVDRICDKVKQFGGEISKPDIYDFMYIRTFKDLDDHHFEVCAFTK
ncbi:VOC family protein [Acholeplasma equirhinis]|uniref:VOC family protein n=1 Tax=Acholeplasma equirhinis TaxID=555393 RepID=UPI00197ABAA2|nr:VOC family protein [Acholeplasma equirhinis]MBN3490084.1 VOC family protein [Acholeplasma equirhinis]